MLKSFTEEHGIPRAEELGMQIERARQLVLSGDEDNLSTRSLLSLVLGSTHAADHVFDAFENLGALEEASVSELLTLPQVGPGRAAAVRATLTLARRRTTEPSPRGKVLECSEDVAQMVAPMLRHERREVLMVLALDARNRLIRSPIVVCVGSLTRAMVEPREVLRPLIVAAAAATVLAHNHPSTCPEPSSDDVALSRLTFEACAMVGIRLLDHIVIGDNDYVSLADRGLL